MQVPDAHAEAEVVLGKRADRADVDDIAGILVVDFLARIDIDAVVITALEDRQLAKYA